jgi:hypothetical protein
MGSHLNLRWWLFFSQLIARINMPNVVSRDLLWTLLARIGRSHPQVGMQLVATAAFFDSTKGFEPLLTPFYIFAAVDPTTLLAEYRADLRKSYVHCFRALPQSELSFFFSAHLDASHITDTCCFLRGDFPRPWCIP